MKIRPVILCGGAGTRLWPETKHNTPKQFIDFGGWCLFDKTLERIKSNIYTHPTIVTNEKYFNIVKKFLLKHKFKFCDIILEPIKKNTGPAIALSLGNSIVSQPTVIFPSDHLIEDFKNFNKKLQSYKKLLRQKNSWNKKDIFIFGIKPEYPSTQYGYFLTKKKINGKNLISKFIEKPKLQIAKKIINRGGYWNSGILFATNEAFYNSFMYSDVNLDFCFHSLDKGKEKSVKNAYVSLANKKIFSKVKSVSFDYAVLEKHKYVNGIKLNVNWSDLGNWFEILKVFNNYKTKYFKKKNLYNRPWGYYVNLHRGKGFLIKELVIKKGGVLSLQKHHYRSERWLVTQGKAKITLNNKIIYKKKNETIEIPKGTIHRIENDSRKVLKIMEAQLGSILKETDIIRFKDIYGRVK